MKTGKRRLNDEARLYAGEINKSRFNGQAGKPESLPESLELADLKQTLEEIGILTKPDLPVWQALCWWHDQYVRCKSQAELIDDYSTVDSQRLLRAVGLTFDQFRRLACELQMTPNSRPPSTNAVAITAIEQEFFA